MWYVICIYFIFLGKSKSDTVIQRDRGNDTHITVTCVKPWEDSQEQSTKQLPCKYDASPQPL